MYLYGDVQRAINTRQGTYPVSWGVCLQVVGLPNGAGLLKNNYTLEIDVENPPFQLNGTRSRGKRYPDPPWRPWAEVPEMSTKQHTKHGKWDKWGKWGKQGKQGSRAANKQASKRASEQASERASKQTSNH